MIPQKGFITKLRGTACSRWLPIRPPDWTRVPGAQGSLRNGRDGAGGLLGVPLAVLTARWRCGAAGTGLGPALAEVRPGRDATCPRGHSPGPRPRPALADACKLSAEPLRESLLAGVCLGGDRGASCQPAAPATRCTPAAAEWGRCTPRELCGPSDGRTGERGGGGGGGCGQSLPLYSGCEAGLSSPALPS